MFVIIKFPFEHPLSGSTISKTNLGNDTGLVWGGRTITWANSEFQVKVVGFLIFVYVCVCVFQPITEPLKLGLGRSEYSREESGRIISKTEGHKNHWKTSTDRDCWYLLRCPPTSGQEPYYWIGIAAGWGGLDPWNCFLTLWWLRELAARDYESASREGVPCVTRGVTKLADV